MQTSGVDASKADQYDGPIQVVTEFDDWHLDPNAIPAVRAKMERSYAFIHYAANLRRPEQVDFYGIGCDGTHKVIRCSALRAPELLNVYAETSNGRYLVKPFGVTDFIGAPPTSDPRLSNSDVDAVLEKLVPEVSCELVVEHDPTLERVKLGFVRNGFDPMHATCLGCGEDFTDETLESWQDQLKNAAASAEVSSCAEQFVDQESTPISRKP